MRVLVTGANGFVGRRLVASLLEKQIDVIASIRSHCSPTYLPEQVSTFISGDLDAHTNWGDALKDVDVVVHLAARVHMMKEETSNFEKEYEKVNVDGTKRLAECAVKAGVKRFVYLSSIKVNGEQTKPGFPFSELDNCVPVDAYAKSKWKAEQILRKLSDSTSMETVIIRPPLIYGAGVKANFINLINLVKKQWPLPFALIHNARSFVYVQNLVDSIIVCMIHPNARNQVYLVSDGEDLSTPALIREIAVALGSRAFLLPIPPFFMKSVAKVLGKKAQIERLTQSLQVDSSKITLQTGWKPKFKPSEAFRLEITGLQ